ncbi:unnamed protein product, partial [Discosporangium mesarthrocarpum]
TRVTRRRVLLFTIEWEDGVVQTDLPVKQMADIVSEDNNSTGKGVALSVEIVDHLQWVGSVVGPVLDEVRKRASIHRVEQIPVDTGARPRDVLATALASL